MRDKKTRKITYYYALNCGILYKDLNTIKMSLVEKECVEKLIKAIRQNNLEGLSSADREAAYALLSEAYALFDEKIEDTDRATKLISYAQEQAEIKEEREAAANQVGDTKLNVIAYNSFEIFPDSAIFAHFKWFSTIPSYVTPLYDLKKKRPGFVVVDVLVKSNITIEDVSFFVEKVNIIRNFKGLPSFAPVLLLNGVSNEALRYLKENKIVVGILSNLFDKKYTETLMNMYNVLRNATAVIMREPQKLEELIKEIAKSEGRFNNAMGDLFECMVGLFFTRIGSRYIELNKQVSNGNGGKYEMDVLVERDGKVIVVECKAYRGKVDRDYVEKWLSSRIPVFRRFLEGIYPGKKFEFSIWSLGGFDESAKELLEKHKTTAKKYKLSYLNKKEIYQYAKDSNDKLFCEQIHKHFKEYGEELL